MVGVRLLDRTTRKLALTSYGEAYLTQVSRLVDEAHAAGSASLLGWQLAENWSIGITDWPDEADALRARLKSGSTRFPSTRSSCSTRVP